MAKKKSKQQRRHYSVLTYRLKGERKVNRVSGVTATDELGARLNMDTDIHFFEGSRKVVEKKTVSDGDWPLPKRWLHDPMKRRKK